MSATAGTGEDTALLPSIQILRALAALAVVIVHIPTEIALGMKWPGIVPEFITLATAADLFFVISGFVIVYSSEPMFGRRAAPRVFLLRRLARTVPLYWAASAILLVYVLAAYPNLESAIHSVGSIVASFALIPWPRPNGAPFPLVAAGWTMPFEMFFYAVFAAAILLTRVRAVLAVTALFVVLVTVGVLVPLPPPMVFWCDFVILDFCFGMAIALAYRAGVRISHPASGALILAAIAAYAGSIAWGPNVAWRSLEWGVPSAAVLAAFVLSRGTLRVNVVSRAFVFLGTASYSLYLVHPIALPLPRRLLGRFDLLPSSPWLYAAMLLVFAIVAAIAVYFVFERPVTRALYRRIGEVRGENEMAPGAAPASGALGRPG